MFLSKTRQVFNPLFQNQSTINHQNNHWSSFIIIYQGISPHLCRLKAGQISSPGWWNSGGSKFSKSRFNSNWIYHQKTKLHQSTRVSNRICIYNYIYIARIVLVHGINIGISWYPLDITSSHIFPWRFSNSAPPVWRFSTSQKRRWEEPEVPPGVPRWDCQQLRVTLGCSWGSKIGETMIVTIIN